MKRGFYKTRAVVLNSLDYGDSDRIITLFTEDHGKLRGIAKGARKSRRRFVNNLEPLCHIDLVFFHGERSGLVRVEEARLIEGFARLRDDIERLAVGCYPLELVSEMTCEGQESGPLFSLLVDFMRLLERGSDEGPLLRFFEIKLLHILGFLPCLTGCVVCREPFDGPGCGEGLLFSSEKGGMICRRCSANQGDLIPVSMGTSRLLSMASRLDTGKILRLKADPVFLREAERVLDDFIRRQTGKELKTKRFLEMIRGGAALWPQG